MGQSGTPRTDQNQGSLAEGDAWLYPDYQVLPGKTFSVVMTGTGDADLYVKFDGDPSEVDYDCRPFAEGADERCTLTVEQGASTASVLIVGFTASTFSMSVSYTSP